MATLLFIVIIGVATWDLPGLRNMAATLGQSPIRDAYPVGIPNVLEPSGESPPAANALSHYAQSYVSDFSGSALPAGWYVFDGKPGGDPHGQFAASHVTVQGGILSLNTWRDPKYKNIWVTGGLCQCGLARTYGAYFVRSRVTGMGPTEVQLLWPKSNRWPPEIDFNETGGSKTGTSSTVHYGAKNIMDQRSLTIDMTQWHTWGVVWSPMKITYVVDGEAWGAITNPEEISRVPMTLDFEQRTQCQIGRECPTTPVSMQIDWVAEYSPT